MIKSNVSFFRKQLGIKGKTVHNGRGMYEMDFDCTMEELATKVNNLVVRHNDKVTVEHEEHRVYVTINENATAQKYYRTLGFNPKDTYVPLVVLF